MRHYTITFGPFEEAGERGETYIGVARGKQLAFDRPLDEPDGTMVELIPRRKRDRDILRHAFHEPRAYAGDEAPIRCSRCGAKIVEEHMTVMLEQGDHAVAILGVPAHACSRCGEAHVARDILDRVNKLAGFDDLTKIRHFR